MIRVDAVWLAVDTDLAALAAEIERAAPSPQGENDKQKPRRQPLPENLPRRVAQARRAERR